MDATEPVMQSPAPADMPKKSSPGAVIGLVVVLAALVAGAWYMWGQRTDIGTPADVSTLEAQGTSTDAAAIESDLSAQSPDDFDKGVDQAFGELDASFEAQ